MLWIYGKFWEKIGFELSWKSSLLDDQNTVISKSTKGQCFGKEGSMVNGKQQLEIKNYAY